MYSKFSFGEEYRQIYGRKFNFMATREQIYERISNYIPPQRNFLNTVIPSLMHFYSFLKK